MHPGDQLPGHAFLPARSITGVPWGVVGTDVMHRVAAHALKAHPDVRLDIAHQVTEVDVAVGVGQGVGDENIARHGEGLRQKPQVYQTRGRRFALPRGPVGFHAQDDLDAPVCLAALGRAVVFQRAARRDLRRPVEVRRRRAR